MLRKIALAAILAAHAGLAGAQADENASTSAADEGNSATEQADRPLEEVVVLGRSRASATDIVQERIDQDVVADFLDAEAISRVGDSSVALALRRVPGLTLVNGEFIYVRGLGERYSSAQLNGASVPSPDLTRNVLPLDIFPTSIVESLVVQKGYSVDRPAAFGGGTLDIRTKGIPNDGFFELEVGSGWNSESSNDSLSYSGGDDDFLGTDDGTRELPGAIRQAIQTYQGEIGPAGIFSGLLRDGQFHAFDEAEAINRELALSLNRNLELREESADPDISLEGTLGNRWVFGSNEQWELGALGLASYDNNWRNRDRTVRSVLDPDTEFADTRRSINEVGLTAAVNLGLRYTEDHEISTNSMLIRSTEDEASITTGHNFNFVRADGQQFRNYRIRYEERELIALQVRGSHVLGPETLELLDFVNLSMLEGLKFEWYNSDSTAETDIPSEVTFSAEDVIDPSTGSLITTAIRRSNSSADYRFTELEDEVDSYGWDLSKAFSFENLDIEISGGWDYTRKGREYLQTQLGLGTTAQAALPNLVGTPGAVFTDANILDPANEFVLSVGGIGTESYLAGQITEGTYGKFDLTWRENWRLAGGIRWEEFSQASLPIDQLEFSTSVGQSVIPEDELDSVVFQEDEAYPALALTYMATNFWAEKFQLRIGWSQTAARPDLREISQATFIDPLTEARVRGNPELMTSDIQNFDIRAEWFFSSGDNFTISAFYKDIEDPIETIEGDGTDDNISLTFVNAESAEVYGIEFEWLKDLSFVSDWIGNWSQGFFLAGNLTLSDSELDVGNAVLDLTNPTRRMSQHSEYVANLQLGYDSPGGNHSASVVYNVFGERLFFAGKNGADDAFEQPFHSLDLVYTYYPTGFLSLKLRLQNLLGEDIDIEQSSIEVFQQEIGTTAKLDLAVKF